VRHADLMPLDREHLSFVFAHETSLPF